MNKQDKHKLEMIVRQTLNRKYLQLIKAEANIKGKPKLIIRYDSKIIFNNISKIEKPEQQEKPKQRIMTADEFEKARLKPREALDWAVKNNVKINSTWKKTLLNLMETENEINR